MRIGVNVDDVALRFSLSSEQTKSLLHRVVDGVTLELYANWQALAKQELHSNRDRYIKGLILSREGTYKNVITLTGVLNNMLEQGASPFDMKAGFAKSSKVKFKVGGGWYLTIPFRQASTGSLGENEVFSGVLPGSVLNAMKGLEPSKSSFKGPSQAGQGLAKSSIPAEYAIPKTRPEIFDDRGTKLYDEYVHKTSIYEGLVQSQETYQNATQNQYNTFRVVSDKSDENSWIHKGFKALKLSEKAQEKTDVNQLMRNIANDYLAEQGF